MDCCSEGYLGMRQCLKAGSCSRPLAQLGRIQYTYTPPPPPPPGAPPPRGKKKRGGGLVLGGWQGFGVVKK